MISIQDMMSHLSIELDTALVGAIESKARTAVLNAWSSLMSETWRYFHRQGTLVVTAAYTTGTVAFTYSTRLCTLTGGTFPTNAADMSIRLSGIWYPVGRRISGTVVELLEGVTPSADIATGPYYIQQVLYPLPVEVGDVCQVIDPKRPLTLAPLSVMAAHTVQSWAGVATYPRAYTLVASPRYPNRYCLWIPNLLTQTAVLQYLYIARRPANVLVRETSGRVTVASGVVTCSEEVISPLWEGALLRISKNGETPTGDFGDDQAGENIFNRDCYEVLVTDYLTSTTCRISDTSLTVATAAPYVASSHIDVRGGAMSEYLQRLVEDQYGVRPVANHTEGLTSRRRVRESNMRAHEEDGVGFNPSSSRISDGWYFLRLADFATGH